MGIIQAVTFDGYGTLLELDHPFDTLLKLLAKKGIFSDSNTIKAAFRAEMAYYRDHHLEGSTPERLHELRLRCADVLFSELHDRGIRAELGCEDRCGVLMAAIRFRAFHDWDEAIATCRREGLKVGIISNWDCALPEQLEASGIDPGVFSVIVTSAAVGACKPNAVVFDCALKSLELEACAVLHVGDDPAADALGARRAGMHGVLLDRHDIHSSHDGMRISCLSELAARIKDMDD